ncbi:hypothetical protein [Beggiatoa leptomitoformis]|uniref:Uncharacterized protein n=1 Tax=Beggiatoa leptomitoformis TaxID=288004 RepID=A0A2N9YDM5_9GAMM|nr:hypothetical protein [Beggiatoa leptomitoformis]ALG69009.1 hypothetical protein AL038_16585 [Beggiatoa leptomitoformis]AUI68592.1 hypothetical protein BLE401_07655 [Beggiatoa leptomitoformis]
MLLSFCHGTIITALLFITACTPYSPTNLPRASQGMRADETANDWFRQIDDRNKNYNQSREQEQQQDTQWWQTRTTKRSEHSSPAITQQPTDADSQSSWGAMQAKQRFLSLHQAPIESSSATPTDLYEQWNVDRKQRAETARINRETEEFDRQAWEAQLQQWRETDPIKREKRRLERMREQHDYHRY